MESEIYNLTKVQTAYQGFASGNMQYLFENLAEDVVWSSHSHPSSPYHGSHHGIESIEKYFSDLNNIDIQQVEIRSMLQNGEKAIALVDIKCNIELNGQITEENYVHVLRLEDGIVTRVDIYSNPAVH